jgi:hypothetical protein
LSSVAHTVSVTGWPGVALNVAVGPLGPCPALPLASNLIDGGVLPLVTSFNASISHSARRCPGTEFVCPCATIVHVSF